MTRFVVHCRTAPPASAPYDILADASDAAAAVRLAVSQGHAAEACDPIETQELPPPRTTAGPPQPPPFRDLAAIAAVARRLERSRLVRAPIGTIATAVLVALVLYTLVVGAAVTVLVAAEVGRLENPSIGSR